MPQTAPTVIGHLLSQYLIIKKDKVVILHTVLYICLTYSTWFLTQIGKRPCT
jgi:hypothetical protein